MPSKVFFSSCFTDPERVRLALRDRIIDELNPPRQTGEAGEVENFPVWMAESWKALDRGAPTSFLEMAMLCVDGVRTSDVYVAVARENYGSPIEAVPPEKVQVSYFEIELFEAALLRKPSFVFLLEGAEPKGRLLSLLRLLEPALPGLDWTPRSEDYVFGQVAEILEAQQQPRRIPLLHRSVASSPRMSDQLTAARHVGYDPLRAGPAISFLGGLADPATEPPNGATVEAVLAKAAAEPNQNRKLSLLWMAIRELMGAPPTGANDDFVPLWETALSSWNAAGAWYGLHGHPHMGCLAALGSLTAIKAERSGFESAPHGGLASEYYSIAKNLGRKDLRADALAMSRSHVDAAFRQAETSGNFGLRGSIRYAQGDKAGAIADYRSALELRTGSEPPDQLAIGESKSELGFALVRNWQIPEGIALMENGVSQLETGPPSGFLIRAKRKLGRAYLMVGAPGRALAELAGAHDLARSHGLLDQIGAIDRLAARVEAALPRFAKRR